MKKLTPDQWMGVVLALMATLVLGLSVMEMKDGFGSTKGIRPGQPMPALAAMDLGGQLVQFEAGQTNGEVLLLDFWATWCPPCIKEMPVLEELHNKHRAEGLRLLAVNTDQAGSREKQIQLVRKFLADKNIDVPVILDSGKLQGTFRVQVLPTLFIIGRDGTIRAVHSGYTDRGTLEREIVGALSEEPPA